MEEDYISFDTAKLAKKLGLKITDYKSCYSIDGTYLIREDPYDPIVEKQGKLGKPLNPDIVERKKQVIRCTQSLLQKYIREEHKIHIMIWRNDLTEKYRPDCDRNGLDIIMDGIGEFDTYEDALEQALYNTCAFLLNYV